MKGGIDFELKADNIIHAPTDTPKHFIRDTSCLMEQTRLHMEERKGQATLGNSTWQRGMAGLFACLFVWELMPLIFSSSER